MMHNAHCTAHLIIGSVIFLIMLINLYIAEAQATTSTNEGIAIWENGRKKTPPGYALYDGSGFSTPQSLESTGERWRIIQGAASPLTPGEVIVVGVDSDEVVTAQMKTDGQGWRELDFSPLTDKARSSYWWSFQVQYESQSGNAMLVWHDGSQGNDSLLYRIWNGSSWSPESKIIGPVGGWHNHIELAASPTSNEMVLVVGTTDSSDYCIVWDGSKWDNSLALGNGDNFYLENVSVAYEQQSGRALVVYVDVSSTLLYRIWDGSIWSKEGSAEAPESTTPRITWTTLGADPSSNRIALGVSTAGDQEIWLGIWDGQGWDSIITASSTSPVRNFPGVAVAFEGDSGRALATYSVRSNEIHYRTWSGKRWSDELMGPSLGDNPNSMFLATSPAGNKIMLSVQDNEQEANFCLWDGKAWGKVHVLTDDTGESLNKLQPLLFLWRQDNLPTSSPTRGPTDQPTLLPTSFPTTKPTRLPTVSPTMMPTKLPTSSPTTSPTLEPTNKPTPLPTSEPTRPPTVPPTMYPTFEPTKSPTKHPTTSPTSTPSKPPTTSPTTESQEDAIESEDTRPKNALLGTGKTCSNNKDCLSKTCRNGVCMLPDCYPVKHEEGTAFDSNAINIIFVASAFDTTTREAWRRQVKKTYRYFRTFNMFSQDIQQLNFFRVDALSKSFCTLGCASIDRLLCCQVAKAHELSEKCLPAGSTTQTVVIHNESSYGGAGYRADNVATMTVHPRGTDIAIHEIGHSLFELGDEYWYHGGGDTNLPYPNCDSSSSCDKWSDLIGKELPGYDPVTCVPGCRNNQYFVGQHSYMSVLTNPVGAVNERFTCCTYQALTKQMPSYCDVFDFSAGYLLRYCGDNDFQLYGKKNYGLPAAQFIPGKDDSDKNAKYVHVSRPVLVKLKMKNNGKAKVKGRPIPLPAGLYRRSQVEGDFRMMKDASKQGLNSLVKVRVFYRTGKEVLLFSRNTTIEVPVLPLAGSGLPSEDNVSVPISVSEKSHVIELILDTGGRVLKRVKAKTARTLSAGS